MSFFNFGDSPKKSDSSKNKNDGSDGFNMFGVGGGASSFLGGDRNSEGNFGDGGNSLFGTGGFEAIKDMENNSNDPNAFSFGLPATPAKKVRNDPPVIPGSNQSYSASGSVTKQHASNSTWGASPVTETLQDVRQSQTYNRPKEQLTAPQDYAEIQHQSSGRFPAAKGTKSNPAEDLQDLNVCSEGKARGKEHVEEAKIKSSRAKVELPGADDLMKQLIDLQRQQLSELLPELRQREESTEQILGSASLIIKEMENYGEKLSGIKHQYSSRLSQVSGFLRLIPKAEK